VCALVPELVADIAEATGRAVEQIHRSGIVDVSDVFAGHDI
jgi:hypothetical protein